MASSSYSNSNQKALTKMNLKARRITVIYIPLRTSGIFWKSFRKEREWHLLYLVESMILKKNNPKGFQRSDFLGHKSTTSTAPNRVSSTWPHAPHPQPSKDDGVAFARPARASATEESGDAVSCSRHVDIVNMLRWRMNPLPSIYKWNISKISKSCLLNSKDTTIPHLILVWDCSHGMVWKNGG